MVLKYFLINAFVFLVLFVSTIRVRMRVDRKVMQLEYILSSKTDNEQYGKLLLAITRLILCKIGLNVCHQVGATTGKQPVLRERYRPVYRQVPWNHGPSWVWLVSWVSWWTDQLLKVDNYAVSWLQAFKYIIHRSYKKNL